MKSQIVTASAVASLAAFSAPLFAGPLDPSERGEIKAMAYLSLSFDGASRAQAAPTLGFTVDHLRRDIAYQNSPLVTPRPVAARSLLDLRLNVQTRQWNRFRIGGVEALSYTTRVKADGTTETVATMAEIPTAAIVAGVVVGAVVIHEATKKDDDPAPAQAIQCPNGTVLDPTGSTCL